jgi:glycerol uptake operon antiterminator
MFNMNDILVENPVVAALRDETDLDFVIHSKVKIVFVLNGSILTIGDICKKLSDAGKIVFIHVDMVEGLKGDMAGLKFLKKYADPDGILTTKTNVIRCSKPLGFHTILRVFILDSLSIKTGIKNIIEINPDVVEIMPAMASNIIAKMDGRINVPIIAGGLITHKEQVMEYLSDGAVAISTSRRQLWDL